MTDVVLQEMGDSLGCRMVIAKTLDSDMYGLLEDCNESLHEQCAAIGQFKPNPGDDTTLWRWTLMIGALLYDVSTSASSLAFHDYRRALIIMRRLVFEYCIRHRFYLQHPDVADRHIQDYFWKADSFFTRLGDPNGDQRFIEAVRQEAQKRGKRDTDKWDNFFNIVADQNSLKADEWYARFYVFPSALIHANPLCSLDLLEKVDENTIRLHMESRRADVNEIVYNLIWFVLGFVRTCDRTFSLGQNSLLQTYDDRLAAVADRIGLSRETE